MPKVIENLVDLNNSLKAQIDSPFRLLSSKFIQLTNLDTPSTKTTSNQIDVTNNHANGINNNNSINENTQIEIKEVANSDVIMSEAPIEETTRENNAIVSITPVENNLNKKNETQIVKRVPGERVPPRKNNNRHKEKKEEKKSKITLENLMFQNRVFPTNYLDILSMREISSPFKPQYSRLPFLHSKYQKVCFFLN